MKKPAILLLVFLSFPSLIFSQKAPAPLFRDPVYDGAADPVVVWNRAEKNWWILYTARRANQEGPDVAYCYGTNIGAASSDDHGQTWIYRGEPELNFEPGKNTFWAPDIVFHKGEYHMFVVYIRGARIHWGGEKSIHHYTSTDLWHWKHAGPLKLSSNTVIDATLLRMPNGRFRMWYKDEERGSITMMSESSDLYEWTNSSEPAIGGQAQEGPKVFEFKGYYWMLADEWHGMRVYRSTDLTAWEMQGLVLDKPSNRPDDTPSGAHGDVVVIGDKAYVFYFTHPGRKTHLEGTPDVNGNYPYFIRRSGLQVAELTFENGTLNCNRDKDFMFYLP
jgi:beta-xylosidase